MTRQASKKKKSNVSPFRRVISKAKSTIKHMNDDNPDNRDMDGALRKFLVDSLRDMYWAEKKLVTTLPKMSKAACCEPLIEAIDMHLKETKTHVTSLEKAFRALGETPRGKKCEAMQGLVDEGATIIAETEADTATRDVGIIVAAQKVEHYEIASYGSLAQLAKTLGEDKVTDILGEILDQEKKADELLTKIAEKEVNYDAAEEPS